jgi:3-hydroxyacyl-CoA dehydrogenase
MKSSPNIAFRRESLRIPKGYIKDNAHMTQPVTLSRLQDIGIISVNNPPVNALSQPVRAGLKTALTEANADDNITALIIHCEGRTFIAGADIREFGKPLQPPGLDAVIDAIENSSKPVIAAIHGTALGGGFEVALGCHHRVAVASAKVGLPEVKLGLLPGAGGTQRLPRLVGPAAALPIIVDGNPVPAPKAAEMGIIDEIIEGELKAAALAFARKVVDEKRPLRKISALSIKLDNPNLFAEFEKSIAKKQRGFPAPFQCIKAVQAACELSFPDGLKRERELFMELMASPQSKAQRHVFFAEREVAKIPGLPEDQSTKDIKSVGIVGAGTMGAGITMCFVNAGIPVTLLEMNQENLDRGLNTIRRNYANSVAKGSLKQADMDKRLDLIKPTLSYSDLSNNDLIIEAVFEEMPIKKEVFAKLDAVCKPGTILASNTSYLNIDEISKSTKRPQDVMGMHFFSPANVMKLLENVRGQRTAPEVYATAMKLGKIIGKVAVLVGVCDGFVGNRMLGPRSREHAFMLEEGALPQQIDKVLYDFGFPMGPFAVGDLAGLDVGWRNRKSRLDRLSPREKANDILDRICEMGRYGQKTGAGFYKYDEKRNPSPDPVIEELIVRHSKERGFTRRPISDQEILERSICSMINEGAKILEEGIVARPLDIDIVWIYGYGFPVYRGGPMFYADRIGLKTVYDTVLKYQRQIGDEYWKPAPLLEKLAGEGKGFYSK